ncbi:hypothetical protein ANTQUA_LOCUS3516 [Anthophora quadrimaculata]
MVRSNIRLAFQPEATPKNGLWEITEFLLHSLRLQVLLQGKFQEAFVLCSSIPDCEATAARLPTLRPDVLLGVESTEAFEDGLRNGHVRDSLLLPILPLQVEDRSLVSQAPALGAQHQAN